MNRNRASQGPRANLSVLDAVCILIGVVVGVGIFKTPSIVAANTSSPSGFLWIWVFGGMISLIGALCYAELGSSNPSVGGEYHFLKRAYGRSLGFFFAWGRLGVIQTGAIAAVAFVLGDYLSEFFPLGPNGPALYAGLAVVILTALNISGIRQSKWTQNGLTILTIAVILVLIVAGVFLPSPGAVAVSPKPQATSFGFAMIFVLLTFGGWNEAVYLSGEVQNVKRNMGRVLLLGTSAVILLYLLLNYAYLSALGLERMSESEAVAADMLRSTLGDRGAQIVSLVIAGATLTTLNATIFTGARSGSAFGQDFRMFRWLGHWSRQSEVPVNALLVQGGLALLLIFIGAVSRQGFVMMVEYTAPVFWLFFLLSSLSLFILRRREPNLERPFKVPLYPITPALFCLACAYMLYSSLTYTGLGALLGIGVLATGVPVLYWSRRQQSLSAQQDDGIGSPKPSPLPLSVEGPRSSL